MHPKSTALDPTSHNPDILNVKRRLHAMTIGQDDAVNKLISVLETFEAGYSDPRRPVGVLLFLGPTGTGKTSVVQNLCEVLHGDSSKYVRLNCADFSDGYQTNRLVGAPPGYIGYKDKKNDAILTQERIDEVQSPRFKLSVVLLDEIEKASLSFYQYLLAIFNDGRGRVDGVEVDFTRTLFVMTSNLGARDMGRSIGFIDKDLADLNKRNMSHSEKAVKDHFPPEFINRIDESVHFSALSESSIARILDVELNHIRLRILQNKKSTQQYVFKLQDSARKELIRLGFNPEYGARPLKRVLNRHVVDPLAVLVGSGQLLHGDLVLVGHNGQRFHYSKYSDEQVSSLSDAQWGDFKKAVA